MEDDEFKIITLGNSGVGKTSIIKRYVYDEFYPDTMTTIGMNILFKDIILNNSKKVKLKIIDTAGEEKYRSMAKSYYKNADGVFFVFALDDIDSFQNLEIWINNFNENYIKNNDKHIIPKYLIGNKSDIKLDKIVVKNELIEKLLKDNNIKHYETTSAKENKNIDKIFQEISEMIYKNYEKNGKKEQKNIIVSKLEKKKEKKCSGCLITE